MEPAPPTPSPTATLVTQQCEIDGQTLVVVEHLAPEEL